MRYLAYDLGPKKIRVNAVSAGPVKTLAASAVGDSDKLAGLYEAVSPLGRNITREEVGAAGMFLLSDLASGITGEILHVDCGYNVMGSPGRAIEAARKGGREPIGSRHRRTNRCQRCLRPTAVGIGLVGRDGCYLVRQRPARHGDGRATGNSPAASASPASRPPRPRARECREEIGLRGRRRSAAPRVIVHRYPHAWVELSLL